MKEAWIILEMQYENMLPINELDGFVVLNEEGNVAIFPSLDAASNYQEEHSISGQCVELPMYTNFRHG